MTLLESILYAAEVIIFVGLIFVIAGAALIIAVKVLYMLHHSEFIKSFF